MTGFEWAMLIMSALSTASALTPGPDVETETPSRPAGGAGALEKALGDLKAPALESVSDLPTVEGPFQQAMKAGKQAPQTQVSAGPQIPAPNQAAVEKAATQGEVEIPNPVPPPQAPPDIGQILASIPDALTAVAPLLGLTDQELPTQRAAPVAGAQGGGLVGRFARQGAGIDIGALLAALPGIRG